MFDLEILIINDQKVVIEDHEEGFYRVAEAPLDAAVWRSVFTQLGAVWPLRVNQEIASWLHANWFREPGMYQVG